MKNRINSLFPFNDMKLKVISFLFVLSLFLFFTVFSIYSEFHSNYGQFVKIAIFSFLVAIAIFIALYIYLRFETFRLKHKTIAIGFLLLICMSTISVTISPIINNYTDRDEWDFLCFYLTGNVAIRGLNFYDSRNYVEVYKELNIPFTPSKNFFIDMKGFLYFPPAIFLFLPLGLFGFTTAQIVWDILLIIFLILDLFILWKFFLRDKSLIGFSIILILTLLNHGTRSSLGFEHYTFIFLFPVLLFGKDVDSDISGLWLALAIFLKPIFLILILYPILRKNWRVLGITITVSIILCLLTIEVFGTQTFFSFITDNGVRDINYSQYIENVNQSLLATILRFTNTHNNIPLFNPIFLISGLITSIITFGLVYKISENKKTWAFALLLPFILFIYPGSLVEYGAILLPVFVLLIQNNNIIPNGKVTVPIILAIIYAISYLAAFLSYFLLWCLIAAICLNKMNMLPLNRIKSNNIVKV